MRTAAAPARGLVLLLAAAILLSWAASLRMAQAAPHHAQGLWPLIVMWAAMMPGMMLPAEAAGVLRAGSAMFLAGYLAPWMAFSAIAAALHAALSAAGFMDHHGAGLASPAAAAGILAVAGAMQLTPMKRACLERCRNFVGGTFAAGLRASVLSITSCGVLMLVPFATGTMNLVAMALLTLVLLAERVAPARWPVSTAAGALLLCGACYKLWEVT